MVTGASARMFAPTFFFSAPSGAGEKGTLTAVMDEGVEVEIDLAGSETRLLHIVLEAAKTDPPFPETSRGRRTYVQLAQAYALHAGYTVPPRPETIGRYMSRIQAKVDAALRSASPGRKPTRIFRRKGKRGVNLAVRILVLRAQRLPDRSLEGMAPRPSL